MINARKDFRESASGKSWNDVVDSTQFQDAAKAAFIEYSRAMSMENPQAAGSKIQGANEFLYVLMHLCELQKEQKGVTSSLNLNPIK